MESSKKFLYKTDRNILKEKREFKDAAFTEPRLVAYMENKYDKLEPAKKILYFKKPKLPINLNLGYSTHTKKQALPSLGSKAALQCTLKYVMSSDAETKTENVDKTIIFTRRGVLIDLMECFYPNKYADRLVIHVTRYNGNLYMARKKNERDRKLETKDTHESQLLKNVFTESLNKEPNINVACDVNESLMAVYQSGLKEFELIYSTPFYGIQAEDEFNDFDNMEALNSCRSVMPKQLWQTLKKNPLKHLNYYLQAHLTNIKDIYLAYKDKNGIVREPIVHKRASDLQYENRSNWNPSNCFAFLCNFLQEINKLMSNDNVNSFNTVYEFNIEPRDLTITYKIFKDNPEMILVTPEYISYCQEKLGN